MIINKVEWHYVCLKTDPVINSFKTNVMYFIYHKEIKLYIVYICNVIYILSSCRAGSKDIPDPLSPLFPIVHRLGQVFWTTSCILT